MFTFGERLKAVGSLAGRLDRHFGRCAAITAAGVGGTMMATAQTAEAGVVDSGVVSIPIPDDFSGVYMDVVTGATASGSFAGYDINPYSAGAAGTSFNLWGADATTWLNIGAPNHNLPVGTSVGPGGIFDRPGGVSSHAEFTLNSDQNYLGFEFVNEANAGATHYGWLQIEFGANPGVRSIVRYAYEDVAQTAITVVPEPGSLGLLALGAVGIVARRRRTN